MMTGFIFLGLTIPIKYCFLEEKKKKCCCI